MNKKSNIYLIVLIWAAALLQLGINNSINREEQLVKQVMSNQEDNLMEGSVRAYGYYGDMELSDLAREEMALKLARKLGISSDYQIKHEDNRRGRTTTFTKLGKNGDTKIEIISLSSEDEQGETKIENYIAIELTLKGSAAGEVNYFSDSLKDIYISLGMETTTNIYLLSTSKGELTPWERQQRIEEFLDNTDSKEVDTIEFDNVYMIYGYSRNIDEFVYQDDSKVNVNIAFEYVPVEDITYIHMGVPFVDRSF